MDLRALTTAWQQLRGELRGAAHILVVDDEEAVCAVLREFFADAGYRVTCAPSVEAAWPLIETERFDLLVTDKNLPGQSGIDLIERLRHERLVMPALLITGYPSLDSVDEALQHGVVDYLSKPFDMEHVQARVAALLDRALTRRLFETMVRDLGEAERGDDSAAMAELKRRLWATRQLIGPATGAAATGVALLGDLELDPVALERALGAPTLPVTRTSFDELVAAIAAGTAPRVVVAEVGPHDLTPLVRQLRAADPTIEVVVVARQIEVARVLAVIHAGAADFVLPAVEGVTILARRVRRLAERALRQRLRLGLLSALHQHALAVDPGAADAVAELAPPHERRIIRAQRPAPPADGAAFDVKSYVGDPPPWIAA
ncbi:MAG: CoB--CoM heterodisulfide reductase subunit [bacterium]|nr:CoB--CoM heterodisulfide reductase subunit [bacterium]